MEGLISADRFQISKLLDGKTAEQLLEKEKLKIVQFYEYKPDSETLENLNQILFKKREGFNFKSFPPF